MSTINKNIIVSKVVNFLIMQEILTTQKCKRNKEKNRKKLTNIGQQYMYNAQIYKHLS